MALRPSIRAAKITISGGGVNLVIEDMRIAFEITSGAGIQRKANRIQVYNLFKSHNLIKEELAIVLQGGYIGSGQLPVIFDGKINKARTYRRGVDLITEIEVLASGFFEGRLKHFSMTYQSPTKVSDVMKDVLTTGGYQVDTALLGIVFGGQLIPGNWSIDMSVGEFFEEVEAKFGVTVEEKGGGRVAFHKVDEDVPQGPVVRVSPLSPQSGAVLVDYPEPTEGGITIKTLIYPDIAVDTEIELTTGTDYSGKWIASLVTHTGDTWGASPWLTTVLAHPPGSGESGGNPLSNA